MYAVHKSGKNMKFWSFLGTRCISFSLDWTRDLIKRYKKTKYRISDESPRLSSRSD